MKALFLKHVPFEGPAGLGKMLDDMGIAYRGCQIYEGEEFPDHGSYDLLFVMGGPMGVYDEAVYPWLTRELAWLDGALKADKKIIGICLGAQLLARTLGAAVRSNGVSEIGWFPVCRVAEAAAAPLPERFTPFHWHGDTFDIPGGAVHLARSVACENQAFLYGSNVLGLQFHLEATLEGIDDLFRHCSAECDRGGPYIQGVRELLVAKHLEQIHGIMRGLLTSFIGV
ncbi:MAG: amidotransferase [Spirochaetes bacterium]|nr:amidotransferase [Spirochaetota bacterium]